MAVLAVAAHSARMLAEAARRDGFEVVAMDLFGDRDTRRAASAFVPIGDAASLHIDATRVLAGLREAAARGDTIGWVAGGGFEGQADLLEAGARVLPLIGTEARAVRRVRDPMPFFELLATHGIGHPPVRATLPADTDGWLFKDSLGCGGRHIRRASQRVDAKRSAHDYAQREMAGVPMSVTFIANAAQARVIGFNELTVRPVAGRPFVYWGAVGPVPVADAVGRQVHAALRVLTPAYALRGLCSLDFIVGDAGQVGVLEINPRPPASMGLYARLPLMRMHVRACQAGDLPEGPATVARVAGHRIVFARRYFTLDAARAALLADRSDVHDLPHAGTHFGPGDPVCSLSAEAPDAATATFALDERGAHLSNLLETPR